MKSLERQSFFAWSATITVLAAVLYLLAGFYLSVIRTVSRLGVSTRQMSRTGLPEIITLESRDELNEVVMRFNEVAVATVNALRNADGKKALSLIELQQQGLIEYIPFPEALRGKYQSYTQADIGALRNSGYTEPFLNVEQGVARYVNYLSSV